MLYWWFDDGSNIIEGACFFWFTDVSRWFKDCFIIVSCGLIWIKRAKDFTSGGWTVLNHPDYWLDVWPIHVPIEIACIVLAYKSPSYPKSAWLCPVLYPYDIPTDMLIPQSYHPYLYCLLAIFQLYHRIITSYFPNISHCTSPHVGLSIGYLWGTSNPIIYPLVI